MAIIMPKIVAKTTGTSETIGKAVTEEEVEEAIEEGVDIETIEKGVIAKGNRSTIHEEIDTIIMEITIDRRGNMQKKVPTIMVPASTRAGIIIIITITTTTATTEEITTMISIKIETTILREKKLRIHLIL
jgi:hypothetical protein